MNEIPPTEDSSPSHQPAAQWEAPLKLWWDRLLLSVCFLTRLPLPSPPCGDGDLAKAMAMFPVAGALIGLTGGLAFLVAHWVLPGLVAALVALAIMTVLTGALHEDGLADLADGLGARGGRERRLEVMRDSHVGAFGMLALVFVIGIKAAALAAAPGGWAGLGALVAAGSLSRAFVPVVMQAMAPARTDGLGAGVGVADASTAALAVVLAAVASIVGLGPLGALGAVVGAAVAALAIGWLARRAIGGYTGDVLGAVVQMVELAVLLIAAVGWS